MNTNIEDIDKGLISSDYVFDSNTKSNKGLKPFKLSHEYMIYVKAT